jgi:hypothetical protein
VVAILLVALLALAGAALATGEWMPRGLVTSGGGEVSVPALTLHSVVGQPVVGGVSNGLTLCSGFQCGPGAPSGGGQHQVFLPIVVRASGP